MCGTCAGQGGAHGRWPPGTSLSLKRPASGNRWPRKRTHALIHTNHLVCQQQHCSNQGSLSDTLSRQQGELKWQRGQQPPGLACDVPTSPAYTAPRCWQAEQIKHGGQSTKTWGELVSQICWVTLNGSADKTESALTISVTGFYMEDCQRRNNSIPFSANK